MTERRSMLVTGRGIGSGRAAALGFARAGYRVVVTDILEAEGSAPVSAIRSAGGAASFAAMDVLVLHAGIAHKVPLEALDDARWEQTIDIDLKRMFRVARAALPAMRRRRSGAIVCLTSLMGLAAEVAADGVRVNAVSSGCVRTAQLLSEEHSLGAAGAEQAGARVPLGRMGEPDDIADVILFLASASARYVTGQVIVTDGGLAISPQ